MTVGTTKAHQWWSCRTMEHIDPAVHNRKSGKDTIHNKAHTTQEDQVPAIIKASNATRIKWNGQSSIRTRWPSTMPLPACQTAHLQ